MSGVSIPVVVAICGVLAAIISGFALWIVARERRLFEEKINHNNNAFQLKLGEIDKRFAEELNELKANSEESKERRVAVLKSQLERETHKIDRRLDVLEKINEENWSIVIVKLRTLSKTALTTARSFRSLVTECADMDHRRLFTSLYTSLKNHMELGAALDDLEGEIRPEDLPIFQDLHDYCMKVFLDLDMDGDERKRRKEKYRAHAEYLTKHEKQILSIRATFFRALGLHPKMTATDAMLYPDNQPASPAPASPPTG